jgi:hypothetical protein
MRQRPRRMHIPTRGPWSRRRREQHDEAMGISQTGVLRLAEILLSAAAALVQGEDYRGFSGEG